MYIRNKSQYPTEEVKRLVMFAANRHHHRVCVNVKNGSSGLAGMAYDGVPSISNAPRTARYLISVRIGAEKHFPMNNYYGKSMKRAPIVTLTTWQEALVFVTAHEFCHIRQYVLDRMHSEVECEKYAAKTLIRFRGGETL